LGHTSGARALVGHWLLGLQRICTLQLTVKWPMCFFIGDFFVRRTVFEIQATKVTT